ncbi:FG-GAP repeat protein [Alginatibacterium sediminis]|nr:FG-GAP repeat protein [Alginatibacterium sediminis]
MALMKHQILVMVMSALLCIACSDNNPQQQNVNAVYLQAFNLVSIESASDGYIDGSGTIKQMTLTWESPLADASITGISYTICERDLSQQNSCLSLATVSDVLSSTIEVVNLITAVEASYFILADSGSDLELSSEKSIDADELTQMIGYVKASNPGDNNRYTQSLDISDDGSTLAIGAPLEDSSSTGINSIPDDLGPPSGAVYLYRLDVSTKRWQQQAYIKDSSSGGTDLFGYSVALSADGNTLIVGAPSEDSISSDSGAVYLFRFDTSSNSWSEQSIFKASNAGGNDSFGFSVSINGDGFVFAAGAYSEDSGSSGVYATDLGLNFDSGAAYVFRYNPLTSTWSEQVYIKSSNPSNDDLFGFAVSLSLDGNTLAVGAFMEDSSSSGINSTDDDLAVDSGAVYLFRYNQLSSLWSQEAYIKASNSGAGDNFGFSIDLDSTGNTLAVGAFAEDSSSLGVNSSSDEAASDAGAAYLFVYDASVSNWREHSYIKSSNTGDGDGFGESVALSHDGTVLAIGATQEDSSGIGINSIEDDLSLNTGAVYQFVYDGSGDLWQQNAFIKASNPSDQDLFGYSIVLSGDGNTLVIGTTDEDSSTSGVNSLGDDAATNTGAAYLY